MVTPKHTYRHTLSLNNTHQGIHNVTQGTPDMIWSNLRDHLFQVVAGATLLAGGGVVVSNNIEVARHDERIKSIETIPETLKEIRDAQAVTNERLTAIETKLEK